MMLAEKNIETIDVRDRMYEEGINQYDMMYKTDHHWNTTAGFYVYGVLEEYIQNKTGCKVDCRVSDASQYTITEYKNWHLGSQGQRTGIYFAGIDDFNLYIPNFDSVIENELGEVGNMQDLAIDMEPLQNREYTSRYTYDTVLGGSQGHFKNLDCENSIKVLVITDSYGKAVSPYLILGFREVQYFYDLNTAMLTPDYIEDYDPDVVILMYYVQNAMNDGGYCFQNFK